MPAIGITGGISTGKTAFCECLREVLPDAKFFDADHAAHQLVDLDPQVKEELLAEFGTKAFSAKGDLNRKQVRAIIFEDAAKKSGLEKILHPRIRRQWSAEAEKHRNSPDFFFADIPLLYETGGEALCDRVVVVACSPRIQLARLDRRLSIGRARSPSAPKGTAGRSVPTKLEQRQSKQQNTAEAMINSQMPLVEKIRKADHVVWNNADRSVLKRQAEKLVRLWRQEIWTRV